MALIVKVNAANDEYDHLLVVRERLDELLIIVRIAKETRVFKNFNSLQLAIPRGLAAGIGAGRAEQIYLVIETEVSALRKTVTNVCQQLDIVDNNS